MKKFLLIVCTIVVLLSLAACGSNGVLATAPAAQATATTTPTGTTIEAATSTPTIMVAPTEVAATSTPTIMVVSAEAATVTPTFPVTIAGGDFLAIRIDTLDDGWQRVVTAGNRDSCAWSNQFKFEMSAGIAAQIPHCWELRMTGTGTVKFEVKPDEIGYDTSDTLKTGLAFWPSGTNGSYRVTRDGKTTDWIPLTMGPEGVNFPKDSGVIVIEFKLENGYMAMPLGEIRNNVLPQY